MNKNRSVQKLQAAGGSGQVRSVRETMAALIREAQRQHSGGPVASREHTLESAQPMRFYGGGSPMLPEALRSLLRETEPSRRLSELVLPRQMMTDVRDLIAEVRDAALLRSHSLEPRHTVLLVGPPGTGKTSMAAALAAELALPFLTVRYEGLVGSYLGETASHLQDVVDYASRTPCVLFFDEFDSVGKERSDTQETGEIKRVVSSLLLHMDALPSHCIVVCATNHPELLDRAVWRRFELRLVLPPPGAAELRDWFNRTEKSFGDLGMTSNEFVELFSGETFSEIEAITLDARRKVVLSRGSLAPKDAFLGAVERWGRRRNMGDFVNSGPTTNRQNPSRTRATKKKTRTTGILPQGDLLGGAGDTSGS